MSLNLCVLNCKWMEDKLGVGFTSRVRMTTSFKARVMLCNVYSMDNILDGFGFFGFG